MVLKLRRPTELTAFDFIGDSVSCTRACAVRNPIGTLLPDEALYGGTFIKNITGFGKEGKKDNT